jgi:hypothetical protein
MTDFPEHTNHRRRMIRCTFVLVCCVTVVYHWNEAKYQTSIWKRDSHDVSTKIWNGVDSSTTAKAAGSSSTKHSSVKDHINKVATASIERIPTSFLPWNVSLAVQNTALPNLQSIQTIYQYFLQHSIDAVVLDASSLLERRFAIAFLPCANDPEAGAIPEWHNFFNTLAWSIITNRTVIVQWYDPEPSVEGVQTIYSYQRNFTCSDAVASNKLQLAPWFLQWEDVQQLDADLYQEAIVPIPLDVQRQKYDAVHRIVAFPQIDSLRYQYSRKKVDVLFHNAWSDHPLSGTNVIQVCGHSYCLVLRYLTPDPLNPLYSVFDTMKYIKFMDESSRFAALHLFYEGSDFLYGAFFRICFPYFNLESPIAPIAGTKPPSEPSDSSFVLMTIDDRTENSSDDGSDDSNDDNGSTKSIDISNEIKCLRRLLPLQTDHKASDCQIVLLYNNPMVVQRLIDWIASSKRSCKVIRSMSKGEEREENDEFNSPRSAIPMSDLRFASNIARTGIIGPPDHPSYQLLVEWMEFQRTIEAVTDRRKVTSISTSTNTTVPPLLWCNL